MPCASLDHGQHCAIWPLPAMLRPLVASLPLPSELVRCLPPRLFPLSVREEDAIETWLLTSKDGCQIWITKGHLEQGAETAPETYLFLAVQCGSGDSWCYSTAVEIQMGFHWFGTHLYTSATSTTQKKKKKGCVGYGYCSQSRASKFILFQWIARKYLECKIWNPWFSFRENSPFLK